MTRNGNPQQFEKPTTPWEKAKILPANKQQTNRNQQSRSGSNPGASVRQDASWSTVGAFQQFVGVLNVMFVQWLVHSTVTAETRVQFSYMTPIPSILSGQKESPKGGWHPFLRKFESSLGRTSRLPSMQSKTGSSIFQQYKSAVSVLIEQFRGVYDNDTARLGSSVGQNVGLRNRKSEVQILFGSPAQMQQNNSNYGFMEFMVKPE